MKALQAHLKSSKEWARISSHADRLLRLQQVYAQVAPTPLAYWSQVAHYKTGTVLIHADNGAAAAKIKQMAPSLAVAFAKRGCEVTEVTVRVQAASHKHEPQGARPERSREVGARDELNRLCARLPESSPLRSSLERLLTASDR